jgi:hypothetical protein
MEVGLGVVVETDVAAEGLPHINITVVFPGSGVAWSEWRVLKEGRKEGNGTDPKARGRLRQGLMENAF